MSIKKKFDRDVFERYIRNIKSEQNTDKRMKLIHAVTSWLDWLKNKDLIHNEKYVILYKQIEKLKFASESLDSKNTKLQSNTSISIHFLYLFLILGSILFNIFLYINYNNTNGNISVEESAGRVIPFKGTIKETDGTPLATKRDAYFNIYSSEESETPIYSGSCLGEDGIEPTFNGGFTILIGSDCGMEPIDESVFSSNDTIYLGVTIGNEQELKPRHHIFTSSFSKDTNKLQGLNLGSDESSIPFINEKGEIVLTSESPVIKSTDGTFYIEGNAIAFSTLEEEGDITFDPALGSNVIVTSGRFGIGTFSPAATLDVSGSSVLSSIAQISNFTAEDTHDTSVLRLGLGTSSDGSNSEFISFFSNAAINDPGVKVGGIKLNEGGVAYETSGADFAEYFEVEDTLLFKSHQIVSISERGIEPATTDGNVLGVISTTAGFIGNSKESASAILVGMIGQVEVLITNGYGEIKKGDYIGTSEIAGYGAKLIETENAVGIALQNSSDVYITNNNCPSDFQNLQSLNGDHIACGIIKIVIRNGK